MSWRRWSRGWIESGWGGWRDNQFGRRIFDVVGYGVYFYMMGLVVAMVLGGEVVIMS